jgi:hypothetical protein
MHVIGIVKHYLQAVFLLSVCLLAYQNVQHPIKMYVLFSASGQCTNGQMALVTFELLILLALHEKLFI